MIGDAIEVTLAQATRSSNLVSFKSVPLSEMTSTPSCAGQYFAKRNGHGLCLGVSTGVRCWCGLNATRVLYLEDCESLYENTGEKLIH